MIHLFAALLSVINPVAPWTALMNAAIAGENASATSQAFDRIKADYIGLWVNCSGTNPDVGVAWQGSYDLEDSHFGPSMTGGGSSDKYVGPGPKLYAFTPVPMRYGRVLLIGNAANGLDTTCTVKVYTTVPIDP